MALNPSHAPRSLCSPSPLLSTSFVNPQAYLSSPLAHLTDLSKRELFIFIPQIVSPSALTPLFLTLHPSHQHTVSVQPQKHIQNLPTSPVHLLPPLSALAWIIAAASRLSRLPDPTPAPNYQGSHMMVQMESCHSPAVASGFHGRESSLDSSKPTHCSELTFEHNLAPSHTGQFRGLCHCCSCCPECSFRRPPYHPGQMGPPLSSLVIPMHPNLYHLS